MATERSRPYHHGSLHRAAMDAAVAEVREFGVAGVSLRKVARRAEVSHAALAYQFGDKAGLFTAVATEGFRLAVAAIEPETHGPHGFLRGGAAYVRFALANPGHFEVMFRPELHHADDPDLTVARDAAFDVLHSTAQANAPSADTDVAGLVVAGWSLAHGFAALWQTANLYHRMDTDPTTELVRGIEALGRLATEMLNDPLA